MVWIILIAVIVIALFVWFRFFKIQKLKNVVFVDGSLGTGKSMYSLYLAIRLYKKQYRLWKYLRKPFSKVFRKPTPEEPLLYSNMPIRGIRHVPLTLEILTRKVRPNYKSVILIDEISIVVDQFDYKDREISDCLRDFFKLARHEMHGGYIVINSQSTADLHYSLKSVLSDYLYIHSRMRLPFFSLLRCREMLYSADKDSYNITNGNSEDVEDSLRWVLVPNSTFKKYDTYYLSALTDNLDCDDGWIVIDRNENAKVKHVLTFKKGRYKL